MLITIIVIVWDRRGVDKSAFNE